MSPDEWRNLVPGMALTVIKLAPDGAEAARYPGHVVAVIDPGSWVVVRAAWTYRLLEMDGLAFFPGDDLLEWFSPEFPFNAFAVISPSGELRGWYANVTKPACLVSAKESDASPELVWHDLYIDLVGLPNGNFTIRDRDELEASTLMQDDPQLFERVLLASDELQRCFTSHLQPFVDAPQLAIMLNVSMNSPTGG